MNSITNVFDWNILYGVLIILVIIFVASVVLFCDTTVYYTGTDYQASLGEQTFPFTVWIINMERNPERYEYVTGQLKTMGIENYERVEATDGKNMSDDEIKSYKLYNYLLNRAQMGCAASHIQIWKRIVDEKRDWTMIIEDDVTFHPNFLELFATYWKHVPKDAAIIYPGCISFEEWFHTNDKLIHETGVLCTHSYLINWEGAKYLLDNISSLYIPIDDVLFLHFKFTKMAGIGSRKTSYFFNGNANVDGIVPHTYRNENKLTGHGIVYQNRNEFQSTIANLKQ